MQELAMIRRQSEASLLSVLTTDSQGFVQQSTPKHPSTDSGLHMMGRDQIYDTSLSKIDTSRVNLDKTKIPIDTSHAHVLSVNDAISTIADTIDADDSVSVPKKTRLRSEDGRSVSNSTSIDEEEDVHSWLVLPSCFINL